MIKISWDGTCRRCGVPLDVALIAYGYYDVKFVRTYIHMFKKPSFFENYSIYKFCGLKAEKICSSCYLNINEAKKNSFYNLKKYGNPTMKRCSYRSVTHDEMKEWFDKMKEFSKRKDIHDLILPDLEDKYLFVCG